MQLKRTNITQIVADILVIIIIVFCLIWSVDQYSGTKKNTILTEEYINTKYAAENVIVDSDPWNDYFYTYSEVYGTIEDKYRIDTLISSCYYTIKVDDYIRDLQVPFKKFNHYQIGDTIQVCCIKKISKTDEQILYFDYQHHLFENRY